MRKCLFASSIEQLNQKSLYCQHQTSKLQLLLICKKMELLFQTFTAQLYPTIESLFFSDSVLLFSVHTLIQQYREYYAQMCRSKISVEMMFYQPQNHQPIQFQPNHQMIPMFSCYYKFIINIIKLYYTMPRLKGKQVKDYLFGDTLVQFQQGSQVAETVKGGKMKLTVYGISNQLIDQNTFLIYNNQVAENSNRIYPAYYQIVRSQNFVYMVFQQVAKIKIDNSLQSIKKFTQQIEKLYNFVQFKLQPTWIFMKVNGDKQLCTIIPYSKNLQKSNNLYTKFHNKSILSQLFCQHIQVKDKQKTMSIISQSMGDKNLFDRICPYLKITTHGNQVNHQFHLYKPNKVEQLGHQKKFNIDPPNKKPSNQFIVGKSTANKVLKQSEQQYPEIDQNQYEELMKYVHVNPNLKIQAENAYMRQSVQNRKQQASKQITQIVDNVNNSIFKIKTYKSKDGKSKVQIKLNKKKLQATQFQVHFEAHYSMFKLIKLTIRMYLDKYKNGFAGIIAAYLLTLIGLLRMLRLYTDLQSGIDVYEIGGIQNINISTYTNIIKKDLAKQARNLVNLKNIIQNANMPMQTYHALVPFLSEDLQQVVLEDAQKFCFFYMTVLMKMDKNKNRGYHQVVFLQTMYVLITPLYSIVYSQEDMPKKWDQSYFQMKKILIQTLIPQWGI